MIYCGSDKFSTFISISIHFYAQLPSSTPCIHQAITQYKTNTVAYRTENGDNDMQMNHYSQSFMPLSFMNSDRKEISSDKTELWQKMKEKKAPLAFREERKVLTEASRRLAFSPFFNLCVAKFWCSAFKSQRKLMMRRALSIQASQEKCIEATALLKSSRHTQNSFLKSFRS